MWSEHLFSVRSHNVNNQICWNPLYKFQLFLKVVFNGFIFAGIYFAEHSSKSNQYVYGMGGGTGCTAHKDRSCYTCHRYGYYLFIGLYSFYFTASIEQLLSVFGQGSFCFSSLSMSSFFLVLILFLQWKLLVLFSDCLFDFIYSLVRFSLGILILPFNPSNFLI